MHMKRIVTTLAFCAAACLALWLFADTAVGGEKGKDKDDGKPADNLGRRDDMESKIADKINKAVEKGCQWLIKQQNADGSWTSSGATEGNFKVGTTALSLFALIKGGIPRRNPQIAKGFQYIRDNLKLISPKAPPANAGGPQGQPVQATRTYTYDVAVTVLALETYYTEHSKKQKKEDEKSGLTTVPAEDRPAKNFHKRAGQDAEFMKRLINWLVSAQEGTQNGGVWRYPGAAQDGSPVDGSNSQYAMLALNAGRRLKYNIPAKVWTQTIDYFVKEQEPDGPDVEHFPVPAADLSLRKLRKEQREWRKKLGKLAKKKRKPLSEEERMKTSVDPYEDYGAENLKMKARGWNYVPAHRQTLQKIPEFSTFCGSMTTSGVAALVIAKAGLEDLRGYKAYKKKCDQAIRDGCAWLAHNFTVTQNPCRNHYNYYYLYGLERAGVLAMVRDFGSHDWYDKGSRYLVAHQQGDGSWPAEGSSASVQVDTCFAILFLCKATTPIAVNPFAETGGYVMDKNKDKEKKKDKK